MTNDRADGAPPPEGSPSSLIAAARAVLGADVTPMPGDPDGERFLVAMPGESALLRLYVRQPERAAVDVALARLVHGLVPTAPVLDWRPPGPGGLGAFLLAEVPAGVRLDRALAAADIAAQQRLGAGVGAVLARLSGMPFLRAGHLVGPDLAVAAFSWPRTELEDWVEERLRRPPLDHWPRELREGMASAAASGAFFLDGVDRSCLVHGSFDAEHVLVDPGSGAVTGLLDWSSAHAGTPVTDLGRLLRDGVPDAFGSAVVDALRAAGPGLPEYLRETAAAADLFALVDLAATPGRHPATVAARARLRVIAGPDAA